MVGLVSSNGQDTLASDTSLNDSPHYETLQADLSVPDSALTASFSTCAFTDTYDPAPDGGDHWQRSRHQKPVQGGEDPEADDGREVTYCLCTYLNKEIFDKKSNSDDYRVKDFLGLLFQHMTLRWPLLHFDK